MELLSNHKRNSCNGSGADLSRVAELRCTMSKPDSAAPSAKGKAARSKRSVTQFSRNLFRGQGTRKPLSQPDANILVMRFTALKLNSLRDLFVEELRDLYSAETQLVDALPKMAEAAASQELASALSITWTKRADTFRDWKTFSGKWPKNLRGRHVKR
jgi:hypothetical protein